jgi:hypothetical protein
LWRNPKSRIFSRLALPKGLRTLVFSFDDAHLTHFSGRVLLPGFCQQLRLRRLLQREGLPPQATGDFQPAGLLRALICVRVGGLKRVSKTQILQSNGVFLCLLGLERFPDPSSLRRCLQRRSPHPIRQRVRRHDRLRAAGLQSQEEGTPRVSSAVVFRGAWAGVLARLAASGRPQRQHRRDWFSGAVRGQAAGPVARARVRLRADAGFFGGKLLGFLEANRWGCVIVAKPYPTIRRRGLSARFEKLGGGWAAGEFSPQAHGWPKARRFVVVRRPVPEDPQAAAQWRRLTHRRSACPVLVANLKLFALASVALLRRAGAGGENDPRTARRSALEPDSLGAVAGHRGVLSDVAAGLCNLGPGFKRLCRPKSYGAATVETVRRDFLAVPGRWVNRAPRQGLHLPRDYPWRAEWLGRGPGDPEIASAPKKSEFVSEPGTRIQC